MTAAAARCGTVRVPENRQRPSGRQIELRVTILPATGDRSRPPLFPIAGGPGGSVHGQLSFYLGEGVAYRQRREIVLVDQRGTGSSNPLICPDIITEPVYTDMFQPANVARCRRQLARRADLRHYGTDAAVADLDAVRAALGFDRISLSAASYGTTAALRYIATHPDRVHAAILAGAAPPVAMPPREHAVAAQRALDLLLAECAADTACRTAFPNMADDLERALALRTRAAPSPERFMEALRSLMYSPTGGRRVPYILHRAARGDLSAFDAATDPGSSASTFADGLYLSITCAESLALMDYPRASAASRVTRFGDYRLRVQRAACRQWPAARVPSTHLAPIVADVPVLFLSGNLDPVTPPQWAAETARMLPNARQLLIPAASHTVAGLSNLDTCYDPLMIRFLDTGSHRDLDPSCLADMRPPPFATGP